MAMAHMMHHQREQGGGGGVDDPAADADLTPEGGLLKAVLCDHPYAARTHDRHR